MLHIVGTTLETLAWIRWVAGRPIKEKDELYCTNIWGGKILTRHRLYIIICRDLHPVIGKPKSGNQGDVLGSHWVVTQDSRATREVLTQLRYQ